MTPLEQLRRDLGSPRWFWPVVLVAMLLVFMLIGGVIDNV